MRLLPPALDVAMSHNYQEYEYSDTGSLGKLIFLILVVIGVAIAGWLLATSQPSEHASVKHPEAESIRKCIEENGPSEIWRFLSNRRKDHYIFCTQMDDGKWGLQIAQLTKDGRWLERTAFSPKSGTRFDLIEYITARAVKIFGG